MFGGASDFNQPLKKWDVAPPRGRILLARVDRRRPFALFDRSTLAHAALATSAPLPPQVSSVTNMDGMFVTSIFSPKTKSELQTAVDLWTSDEASAEQKYGLISTWDVSAITDMSGLFAGKKDFNDDISAWDARRQRDGFSIARSMRPRRRRHRRRRSRASRPWRACSTTPKPSTSR